MQLHFLGEWNVFTYAPSGYVEYTCRNSSEYGKHTIWGKKNVENFVINYDYINIITHENKKANFFDKFFIYF